MLRTGLVLAVAGLLLAGGQLTAPAGRALTFNASCSVASLKQAIVDANANPGHDIIRLAADCTYVLETVDNTEFDGDNGLPIITETTTIDGTGATIERSFAGGTPAFRILRSTGPVLNVANIIIRNGSATTDDTARGGGIRTSGDLFVENSQVVGNVVEGVVSAQGGGTFSSGHTIVTNSNVVGNRAVTDGAPIQGSAQGGGSYANETLTISNATYSLNQVISPPGTAIGAAAATADTLSVTDANLALNTATGNSASGGGAYSQDAMTITDSRVRQNTATSTGTTGSTGGGAYSLTTVTVVRSTFNMNNATAIAGPSRGGGSFSQSASSVTASTYSQNSATSTGSTGEGGGVFALGTLGITNSTVSANSVSGTGNTAGGGLFAAGQITAQNLTATENVAPAGKGGGIVSVSNGITLTNSIVVENPGGDCDVFTAVTASFRNLDSDGSCGDATVTANAGLLPLDVYYPSRTATHGLDFGSPALDIGFSCEAADQRDVARPQGAACDLGAYELSRSFGDANCDGLTNSDDVILLLELAAGFPPPDDNFAPCSREFDGQQGTGPGDALFVRRIIAGLNQQPN